MIYSSLKGVKSLQISILHLILSAILGLIGYSGQIAQLVEQWTENPRVGSSNLPLAIIVLHIQALALKTYP